MSRQGSMLPSLVDERVSPSAQRGGASSKPKSRRQQWMAVFSVVVLIAAGALIYWQLFTGPPSAEAETRRRDLIDAKSGKFFKDFKIPANSRFPYTNPDTGEATLFPTEKCFWTRDGKAKLTPTHVLLNEYAGRTGDTICPDCGRKVVPHNPMPPPAVMKDAAPPAD